MEKKHKLNYFKAILYIVIFLYIIVYIVGNTGYYENKIASETNLTEDAIVRFEQDILDGKVLDLTTYVVKETESYESTFASVGEKLNEGILIIVNDGLLEIGNIFKYLVT